MEAYFQWKAQLGHADKHPNTPLPKAA